MENTNFHSFKSFLTERFTAVAVEIFGEVEHIVEEYRAENKRLHDTLNSLLHPEIKLRRIEHQTSTAVVHEQPPEQRAGLGPESPETWHPTIKVEQIEYETGPGEDQPQGPEGAGNMNIIVMPVCVKSDTEQDLSLGQISNSYHDPVVECPTESEFTIKVEEVAEEISVKNEMETHEHLEATADRSHLSGESESTIEAEETAVNNEMETHQHLEATADRSRLSRERKNKLQSRAGCEEECGNCLGDMGGKRGLTKKTAKRPLQKTMLELPRMTYDKSFTAELTDCKIFMSRLTEAYKDFPDDKKPLIAAMGISDNVELVDCAFGKVPKGCPLSYQCPVPSSRDYSPHEDAPLPPSLPENVPKRQLEPLLYIPDLSVKEQEHLKALETTWDAAHNLERSTRERRELKEELRKSRLTSRFREICNLKSGRSHAQHLVLKIHKGPPKSKTTMLDNERRPEALREYCKHMSVNWSPCGLVVHPKAPWLAAMPDGVVYDPAEKSKYGLVHIKFPQTKRFVDSPFIHFQYGVLELKKNHNCYWQLQGEMMVTGTEWCDLVVYAEDDLLVQRVYRNKAMIKVMKEKLDSFFFHYFLPSLT